MKNLQKGFALLTILLIAAGVLVVGGAGYWYYQSQNKAPELIGGQKDEHGCLGPAGYSWCEVKQKCLRVWEEKCEATSTSQTASGTPVTLTTIDICSPLFKDASTLLFTDDNNKVWTVNYSKATFTRFGTISKTVLSTNLQDWVRTLYRVGGPQSEICGAPGKITVTGSFDGTTVFASHIELSGQG